MTPEVSIEPARQDKTARPKPSSTPRARSAAVTPADRKQTPAAPQDPSELLTYPRDADRVVATVNDRKILLREIIEHIDRNHFPDFEKLSRTPAGQIELRTPRMADWVRHFADLTALRTEARSLDIKEDKIKQDRLEVYTTAFRRYKDDYEKNSKRPFPSGDSAFEFMRNKFQKREGLFIEVEGLLNTLVPDQLDRRSVVEFYNRHHQAMSGYLTIAQIYVSNRDPKTGALLTGKRGEAVAQRIRKIQELLAADGSNFETVAAEWSEDRRSASHGGRLENLQRFDPRLPAILCKTAWDLRDGAWTGPVQTRFGLHFIKRVKWIIRSYIINPDPDNKEIRRFVRSHRKEVKLFELRRKHRVTLLY
ncbi:MAG: peptidylprolyl isomerase [Planctomycetes bacterium]|nr:peptidylprolyl isomerase [Planctomycetota bacterium]MCB9868858.1 peptidylprolyl isomerase [Planctomycetota bacterium]MCB9889572.1 peptidylprolyl isomerase [Planctomycetota bacterium]